MYINYGYVKMYDKTAVLNASYKNSDKAYFKLDVADDTHVAVIIKLKKKSLILKLNTLLMIFVMKL